MIQPFAREFLGDPYPLYERLRREPPAPVEIGRRRTWLLSRFDHVAAALRDRRLGHAHTDSRSPLVRLLSRMFLELNSPQHDRLRTVVSRPFSPRSVAHLAGFVERQVDGAVRRALAEGGLDVVADLAAPLPVSVVGELLGVPPAERPRLKRWSASLVRILDPLDSLEELQSLEQTARELMAYFGALLEERRVRPAGDVVSAVARAAYVDGAIDADEALGTCALLVLAGLETTPGLLGGAVWSLLRHPEQVEALRADWTLVGSAVEELVRYESPTQRVGRVVLDAMEIDGVELRRGDAVILLVGAANRDETRFARPERLDVARTPNDHLGFGAGLHYCLGAHLARLQARVVLGRLFETCELRPAGPVRWRESFTLRTPAALPVTVGPRVGRVVSA